MTWREFQLKLLGYRRQQREKWEHTRVLAHMIYLSIPEKGNKKSIDQFWPLDSKGKKVTEAQKELIKEAFKRSMEEAKQKMK